MEWVYLLARLVHIACGSLALLAGPVAMLTSRTRRSHRAWGQGYLALVVALVLSGMVLLGRQPTVFSFGVAVLSLLTALSATVWCSGTGTACRCQRCVIRHSCLLGRERAWRSSGGASDSSPLTAPVDWWAASSAN